MVKNCKTIRVQLRSSAAFGLMFGLTGGDFEIKPARSGLRSATPLCCISQATGRLDRLARPFQGRPFATLTGGARHAGRALTAGRLVLIPGNAGDVTALPRGCKVRQLGLRTNEKSVTNDASIAVP
jgi:hypothetical protein